jgi:thioredoxin reductase (NADPH)
MYDVIIVGAGPIGLSVAVAAGRHKLDYLILEKGLLVNSVYNFPVNMTFFSSGPELEIGEVPFIAAAFKPTRMEALQYYRRIVAHFNLNIKYQSEVREIKRKAEWFEVQIFPDEIIKAQKVVIASGYYDRPNMLDVPGEDLNKVRHYYKESHPYFRKKVMIVGGRNSAAEAALEIFRAGGEVTLVHRGKGFDDKTKYWVKPDIDNRIARGEIKGYFVSRVLRIDPTTVTILVNDEEEKIIENDYVLALIGYSPNASLMRRAGINVDGLTLIPEHDKATLETNVNGLYIAGALTVGREANRIFIENGRLHGELIATAIEKSQG